VRHRPLGGAAVIREKLFTDCRQPDLALAGKVAVRVSVDRREVAVLIAAVKVVLSQEIYYSG